MSSGCEQLVPQAPLRPLALTVLPSQAQQGGLLAAMEPGVAWEARLQLSGHAEPSQELVGASEGPKGLAALPATLSSHPHSHHHTDSTPGSQTRPPRKDPDHPPLAFSCCVPGALPSLFHAPFNVDSFPNPGGRSCARTADTVLPTSDILTLAETGLLPHPHPHMSLPGTRHRHHSRDPAMSKRYRNRYLCPPGAPRSVGRQTGLRPQFYKNGQPCLTRKHKGETPSQAGVGAVSGKDS